MRITSRTETAVELLAALAAEQQSQPICLQYLASVLGRSASGIEPICARLVAAELLVARRGPKGGYLLARDPIEITLEDIRAAAEHESTPTPGSAWGFVAESIGLSMDSVSLAEVRAVQQRRQAA